MRELPQLARAAIERWLNDGHILTPVLSPSTAVLLAVPAACFVTLHAGSNLRGCIGTLLPTEARLADEIVRNAISAATKDPRFEPLTPSELAVIAISVDVLSTPEPARKEMLDVRRYGVIVSSGHRRGVLLPDLEGVDSVAQQLDIACRKAGISPSSDYHIERFTVTRHTEGDAL